MVEVEAYIVFLVGTEPTLTLLNVNTIVNIVPQVVVVVALKIIHIEQVLKVHCLLNQSEDVDKTDKIDMLLKVSL